MFQHDLGSALRASALRHRDRPALWVNGQRLSYGELFDAAAAMANTLRGCGLQAGERVAILSHRTRTPYVAILGALLAGNPFVNLSTRYPAERNGAILRSSGAKVLILGYGAAINLDDLLDDVGRDITIITPDPETPTVHRGRRQVSQGDLSEGSVDSVATAEGLDRDQPAYIVYTSGTTGEPKGVATSHANISAYLQNISAIAPHTAEDRVLQLHDLTFDPFTHDMGLAWLNGGELYSMPENSAMLAPRLIEQHAISSIYIVPSIAARSLHNGLVRAGRMSSLRYTFFCGEPLSKDVARSWSQAAPSCVVYNLYGPTEATVSISGYKYAPDNEPPFSVLPIGRPFPGQGMALFDDEQTPTAVGGTGEIFLSGSQVMTGYWNAPHLNEAKFVSIDGVRWYKSGDLARWDDAFGFIFGGRTDRQVKVRGHRTELHEIEDVLRRVSGQPEAAVVPWPVTTQGSYDGVVAFMPILDQDENTIRSGCKQVLADYMAPDRVIFLRKLPVNLNGKIDYQALGSHPALTDPDWIAPAV